MLLMTFGLLAVALQEPPATPEALAPRWRQAPRLQASDYPNRALQQSVSGSAVIRCQFHPSGQPSACGVESETPVGYGFGTAALRVVERARLDPDSLAGAAPGASFTVRIVFSVAP